MVWCDMVRSVCGGSRASRIARRNPHVHRTNSEAHRRSSHSKLTQHHHLELISTLSSFRTAKRTFLIGAYTVHTCLHLN